MEGEQTLKGLYSPSLKQVGCVIIAAAMGADRRVNSIVSARDWFTSPPDDMVMIAATAAEWRRFAASAPAERPGPEHFAKATS